jgi:hypothetical protein
MKKPRLFTKLIYFELGLLLVLASCTGEKNLQTNAPIVTVTSRPPVLLTQDNPTLTNISSTDVPFSLPWVTIENRTSANKIRTLLVDSKGNLWTGGPGGLTYWDLKTEKSVVYAMSNQPNETNVVALAQTIDNKVWIGTFGNGISSFDGATWQSFTSRDRLPGDYIISLISSQKGGIWIDTQETEYRDPTKPEAHFIYFDGANWFPKIGGGFTWIKELPDGSVVGARGDTGIGIPNSIIAIFDGEKWNPINLTGQSVTAITVSADGVIWVATPNIIFRYVDHVWESITPPWKESTGVYVSSMAISSDGVAWLGFSNGAGLFQDTCGHRSDYVDEMGVYRYDGKTWTQFTTEDGLVDNKICAITLDANGNVWFGSFDKGVSRFDGKVWTSYVIP